MIDSKVVAMISVVPLLFYIYAKDLPHGKTVVIEHTVEKPVIVEKPGPRTILGATMNEVARLNGVPPHTREEFWPEPKNTVTWIYVGHDTGAATYIKFCEGRVVDWNDEDRKLKLMLPE